jgi:hypothetical protein
MYYMLEKYNTHTATCHDAAWFQLNGYTKSHNNTTLPKKKSTGIHEVSLHNVNVLCGVLGVQQRLLDLFLFHKTTNGY